MAELFFLERYVWISKEVIILRVALLCTIPGIFINWEPSSEDSEKRRRRAKRFKVIHHCWLGAVLASISRLAACSVVGLVLVSFFFSLIDILRYFTFVLRVKLSLKGPRMKKKQVSFN